MSGLRGLVIGLVIAAAGYVSPAASQDAQARLWDGAIQGDTVAILAALNQGASIDSLDTRRSGNGRRALNWAALGNQVSAIRLLLSRGARLDAVNLTGFTPLHHAAEAGAVDAARALLEAGADPSYPNRAGRLPAETAEMNGFSEVARLLRDAAAPGARQRADTEAIVATARNYIDGFFSGDSSRMRRALHPELAKRVPGPQPRQMSADDLVGVTGRQRSQGSAPVPADSIRILDQFQDMATVRIGVAQWVDYLHLSREPTGWRIIQVLWQPRRR